MNLNELSIEELVKYINIELQLGRTMKDIEVNDFKVNDRVLVKRLNRKGYKRIGNEFVKKDNKEIIQKYNKDIIKKDKQFIQKYNKEIGNEKLLELVELLEPIKDMIMDYNNKKNIIEVDSIELRPKAVTNVKQNLFKIDIDVL